ncbi:MAG: SRPBCC family protein, partial [Flavobacteriaceae bacterium]|nr:SRPBCC family protein [Flavobacteriaceae bacterium]
FDITSTKTINAPVSMLFNNVNDFKNWQDWGPWMADDPNIQITYADTTMGVGGAYSWISEEMGDGSMKTLSTVENESIDQKIVFITPMGESTSDVYWKFKPSETGTEVTWGMKGEQSFMGKVFMAFQSEDFETSMKKMYSQGLNNLEQTMQLEMEKYSVTVEGIKDYGGGYYMYTTTASTQKDIGNKMRPMMGKVTGFMQQNNITMTGMPFTIYNEWDQANGTVIFSTAIPTSERIKVTEGDVLCGYMEPTAAVKTILMGNYTNLAEAYTKAQAYIAENNLIMDPAKKMFEVYSTDPELVPNPADWRTDIYVPVFRDLRSNHPLITEQ